jgi:hypothetical protein
MDVICQVAILVFGCSAIWFVGRLEDWKKWGYILGLCSQPFWIWTTISHKQYGITLLSFWYTYSWCQGIYNYWIKPYMKRRSNKCLMD